MDIDITKRKYVSAGMFRPLRKQRFSDQIADLIQKKILEDHLAIGTGLPSDEPIKRSISNLIALGDVTIDHLFEARLLIEPQLAKEAARQAKKEDLKKFRDLLEDSAMHLDDPIHLKQNNLRFHLLLAKASGNPVLAIMLESVFELLVEHTLDFVDLSLERHFFEIHKKILQVLEEKKPAEAEKLIKADIMDVRKKIKEYKKVK